MRTSPHPLLGKERGNIDLTPFGGLRAGQSSLWQGEGEREPIPPRYNSPRHYAPPLYWRGRGTPLKRGITQLQ